MGGSDFDRENVRKNIKPKKLHSETSNFSLVVSLISEINYYIQQCPGHSRKFKIKVPTKTNKKALNGDYRKRHNFFPHICTSKLWVPCRYPSTSRYCQSAGIQYFSMLALGGTVT